MLLNHVGDHFAENNRPHEAALYFQKAKEAFQRSKQIRKLLIDHERINMDEIEEGDPTQEPQNRSMNNY